MDTFDLVSDISKLTTIPDKTLRNLCDKGIECICHDVIEMIQKESEETNIELGIGLLKIIKEEDELHYRFIPSSKLEDSLINSIVNNEDPLTYRIEEALKNRIVNTYKELI